MASWDGSLKAAAGGALSPAKPDTEQIKELLLQTPQDLTSVSAVSLLYVVILSTRHNLSLPKPVSEYLLAIHDKIANGDVTLYNPRPKLVHTEDPREVFWRVNQYETLLVDHLRTFSRNGNVDGDFREQHAVPQRERDLKEQQLQAALAEQHTLQQKVVEYEAKTKEVSQLEADIAKKEEALHTLTEGKTAAAAEVQKLRDELQAALAQAEVQREAIKAEANSKTEALKNDMTMSEKARDEALRLYQTLKDEVEGLGFANQRAREKAEAERNAKSALDFYDVIVNITDLKDVFKGGWGIAYKSPDMYKLFTSSQVCGTVGVLGNFNAGKSFVLGQLGDISLQTGDRIHTMGMSVKMSNLKDESGTKISQQVFFIDTEGINSPVTPPNFENVKHVTGEEAIKECLVRHDEMLQAQKSREDLMKQTLLHVSDVFLFVVGQLSSKDQLDLFQLHRSVAKSKQKGARDIIVVHNLRDWTHADLMSERYVEKIHAMYPMLNDPVDQFKNGSFKYIAGDMGSGVNVHHFFMTKQDAAGCQNKHVINRLRQVLMHKIHQDVVLSQRFLDVFRQSLGAFVAVPAWWFKDMTESPSINVQEVPTRQEASESTLQNPRHVVKSKEEAAVELRQRSLGTLVSVTTEDRPFSIVDIPVLYKHHNEDDEIEEQTRILRCVVFETPGLTGEVHVYKPGAKEVPGADEDHVRVTRSGEGFLIELKLTIAAFPSPCLAPPPRPNNEGTSPPPSAKGPVVLTQQLMNRLVQPTRQVIAVVHDEGSRPQQAKQSDKKVVVRSEFMDLHWQIGCPIQVAAYDGLLVVGCITDTPPEEADLVPFTSRNVTSGN